VTARRVLLLTLLLAAASIGVRAQQAPFTITPTSLPVGGGMFVLAQTIPVQQLSPNPQLDESFGWAVSSGNLPPGLNLDQAAGTITGTPTQAGAFTFTIFAQEIGTNFIAFQQYTVYVSTGTPLSLAPLTHPQAAVGVAYSSSTFRAAGGVPGYTFTLQSGTNADGLALNATTGQLSGTPVAGGVFPIAIVATDASGAQVSATFTLNVLGISTALLPNGTVGSAYSQTLAAVGATGTLSWLVTGNNFPPVGLSLSSQGQITGTPTATGTFPFVVQVTDSATNLSATQALSITIAVPATISPASLPNGVVNVPYTATTLTVSGIQISNWAVTVGTLPAGLNLNAASGVISGTPTAAGSSTFTITATGGTSALLTSVLQQYTIVISAAPSITISGLPSVGVAATQASASVALSGGTYPLPISGTMTLSFVPTSGVSQIYDAKFATGPPTTAAFNIPAGTTQGVFNGAASVPVMTGTVAGTITITTVLQNSTLTPPAPTVITVSPTAPVISKVTFASANGAFSISVTGYSTPRDMTSVLFQFTPTTSGPLTATDFTIPLTSAFTTWYNSSASTAFGSQSTMTVPFAFTHPPGATIPCLAVNVTLTNSKGSSSPSNTSCQAVLPPSP